jgi:hypothetical protein
MYCTLLIIKALLHLQHAWSFLILRSFKIWSFQKFLKQICQSRKLCTDQVCLISTMIHHHIKRVHGLTCSQDTRHSLNEKKASRLTFLAFKFQWVASDVLVTQKLQAVLVAMKPWYVIGSILQPLDIRWYILPLYQIIRHFGISKFIALTMYLDITYI